MEFACDCSDDSGDPPDVWRTEIRTARIAHHCGECGDEIKRGERYEYNSSKYEWGWDTHKTCLFCKAMRDKYCPSGYIYGNLVDQVSQCLGFHYTDDPAEMDNDDTCPKCQGWNSRACDLCGGSGVLAQPDPQPDPQGDDADEGE